MKTEAAKGFGAVLLVLAIGLLIGGLWGAILFSTSGATVPRCQEDEIWYPEDFPDGPLQCYHYADFAAGENYP